MNALTKAAKQNPKTLRIENYAIAVVCGVALGVMLGMGV